MPKTETESRCIAECCSCGQVFPAKIRVDGSPRPMGIDNCNCGGDEFSQMGV